MNVSVKIDGEQGIQARYARIQQRVKTFRKLFDKRIYPDFMRLMRDQFKAEGRSSFLGLKRKWRKLSPEYGAWKRKHYPGKTILRRTDKLFESLTEKGSAGAVYHRTPTKAFMGTRVSYAIYHQRGTEKMPRRRIVRLTRKYGQHVMPFFRYYVLTGDA